VAGSNTQAIKPTFRQEQSEKTSKERELSNSPGY